MNWPEPELSLPNRRGMVEYALGSDSDHEGIFQTLIHVFHGPDREQFLGALGDPAYKPEQRLLVKVDGRVASHVHLTSRSMRFGATHIPMNGVMWVGTLPEYRGLGFAQNLMRLADQRARETGVAVQALTTGMPKFYRALGWGPCGKQSLAVSLSRNLPSVSDGVIEGKGGFWHVRPWRQVELGCLMKLYEKQFARTTGTVARSEDYWRWMIGRKYAHVIWVACQGETVRGYAFVKDHKILEIASDPAYPQALKALLGRVRAEALERAYPEVIVHAPPEHPVIDAFRAGAGRTILQEEYDGVMSMYHIPDVGKFLQCALPELRSRAETSGINEAVDLGFTVGDRKWLLKIDKKESRVEPDRLGRRHLTMTEAAATRLLMGHTGIDAAISDDGVETSTGTAIELARVLFPARPIWRSPLDSATA